MALHAPVLVLSKRPLSAPFWLAHRRFIARDLLIPSLAPTICFVSIFRAQSCLIRPPPVCVSVKLVSTCFGLLFGLSRGLAEAGVWREGSPSQHPGGQGTDSQAALLVRFSGSLASKNAVECSSINSVVLWNITFCC